MAIFAPENRYSHGAYLATLLSLFTLFLLRRLVCAPRARVTLKKEQSCWKMQSKERSHDAPARGVKKKGERGDREACISFDGG